MDMNGFRLAMAALTLCGAVGSAVSAIVPAPPAQPQASARIRALLIGVTKYPQLKDRDLNGPANDVALMMKVLTEAFGVAPSDMTVLVEPGAIAGRTTETPTRDAILRELRRIAKNASAGEQYLVYFSGHGSRQPDGGEPDDDEPDGLDEVVLPSDVSMPASGTDRIPQAIVDDEIRTFAKTVNANGAFLWLMFDACNSGTLLRDLDSERARAVYPEDLFTPEVLAAARQKSLARAGSDRVDDLADVGTGSPLVAALYAAQKEEPTPERPLPDWRGQVYGIFTHSAAKILLTHRSMMTYRDLTNRILEDYRGSGRVAPTPMCEGGGVNRAILGQQVWARRPALLLGQPVNGTNGTRWLLRAGNLDGIAPSSILEVFPPAGAERADVPVGFVKVVSVASTTAEVEPVAFGEMPAPAAERLAPASRAQIARRPIDAGTVKIALQVRARARATDRGAVVYRLAAPREAPEPLAAALADLASSTRGFATTTQTAEEADWFLRIQNQVATLVPASGWSTTRGVGIEDAANPTGQPVYRIGRLNDPSFRDTLRARVESLWQVKHLMAMAAMASRDPDLSLPISMIRHDQRDAAATVIAGGRVPVVPIGAEISFQFHNESRSSVDVTILNVDANYGIQLVYPAPGVADNRLAPREKRDTIRFKVGGPPGREHLIAVAVRANGPQVILSQFVQPPLPQVEEEVKRLLTLADLRHTASVMTWLTVPSNRGRP